MKLLHLAVVACALACALAQDAYTQGLVQGGTLALAATAVVGLGVLAVQNNNRNRNRYRPYAPRYQQGGYYGGGGGYYGGYQPQPYYGGRYRRDAADADAVVMEQEFEKVLARDKQECGLRLVCELEARTAAGEDIGEDGQVIVDGLFGSRPQPVPSTELTSARGQYNYAAYLGSQADVKTCADLYSTCKYSSKVILSLVQIARQVRT